MPTELYDLTIPVYTRGLGSLSHLLEQGRAHVGDEGAAALLGKRLAEDMHPLSKQIQIACDSAKLCVARLSGIDAPVLEDTGTTVAELQARIQTTLAYLASVPRSAIDGQESKQVVLKFPGGEMPFEGIQYVLGFAHPNFYFHVTTAYALLRNAGVQIGKRDFLHG